MTRRLFVLAGTVMAVGCGHSGPSRAEVMEAYGRDIAVPAFQRFAATAGSLAENIAAMCAAGDGPSIAAALDAVDVARGQWLETEANWTGPAMERRSPAVVDWPVNGDEIEELVTEAKDGAIDDDLIAGRVGADNRGLSAMKWVLDRDDVTVTLADRRWCDYLTASAEVISTESDLLVGDWTQSWQDGPPFVDALGSGDATVWLAMLVNDNLALVHRLAEAPEDEGDAPPVDVAADRAVELDGVREVAAALGPLLGEELEGRLLAEIDAAAAAYEAGDIEAGRTAVTDLERTLGTEVASKLAVTIGFSDADGDSAG